MTELSKQRSGTVIVIFASLFIIWSLRLLALQYPDARLWGFNHLLFIPKLYTYIYLALGIVILVSLFPPIRQRMNTVYQFVAESLFRVPIRNALLLACVFLCVFFILRMPTNLLGDGYAAINNVSGDLPTIFKWSEVGAYRTVYAISLILPYDGLQRAEVAYALISIFSGAVALLFLFLTSAELAKDSYYRLFIFGLLTCSGSILLFFGYAENYPILWPFVTGYIYFSLRYFNGRSRLIIPILLFIAAGLLHLQVLFFVPSFLILLAVSNPGKRLFKMHRLQLLTTIVIIAAVGVVVIGYKMYTSLSFSLHFLPIFDGHPIRPDYAILSWKHLTDILNHSLLVAPMFLLLVPFALMSIKKIAIKPTGIFLALFAFGGMAFLLFIDPKLGMGRDWDLFALTGLAPVLLLVYLGENELVKYRQYFAQIIIMAFVCIIPFLATNLNRQSSITYMSWLLRMDHEVSRSGMATLRDYYFRQEDAYHADSLDHAMRATFVEYAFRDSIFALAGKGNPQLALSLADSLVNADPYEGENYNIRGSIYYSLGRYREAINDYEKTKTLKEYDFNIFVNCALAYQKAGDLTNMFKNLRIAQERAPDYPKTLLALSQGFMMRKQYDSAFAYGRRAIEIDKANPMGYLSAGSAAYYLRDKKWARTCLTKYLQMEPQSTVRQQVEDMLSKIPE